MDTRDEFENWVSLWDKASKELDKEKPPQKTSTRTSYFNDFSAEEDYNLEDPSEDSLDLYRRSLAIGEEDQLLTDSFMNGYTPYEPFNKAVPQNKLSKSKKQYQLQNPIHFASVGNDQEGEDGHVRVSNNFSQGKELEELAELKKTVEIMEREFHDADVRKEKKKKKLELKLKKLRQKVKELSQKIVPQADKDLS